MEQDLIVCYKEWDSVFFHKKIYQIVLESHDVKERVIDLQFGDYHGAFFQVQTAIDDYQAINFLLSSQFKWVNNSVEFSNSDIKASDNQNELVKAKQDDLEAILDFVPNLFVYSRFATKGYFEVSDADRLYLAWVKGAYDGAFDDELLVMKYNGAVLGFVTLRYQNQNSVKIGLIGVNPLLQIKNKGSKLMHALHSYCIQKNMSTLYVTTQLNNDRAIGLYSKLGYRVMAIKTWFYRQ